MTLPFVLVHGIRVSGTMWNTLHPLLAGKHRVATPDLPGHGTRRGERFSMDAAVDAVASSIDAVGGRAVVVGLSLGGYVGITTAARHPERVAGLVAFGCTSQPSRLNTISYKLAGVLALLLGPERANRASERVLRRTLPPELADAFLAGGQSCEVISPVVRNIARYDYCAALAQYRGPVWLMNGLKDPLRLHEAKFLKACVHGKLTVIPGRGHLTTLLDAKTLAHELHEFAQTLDVDTAPAAKREPALAARP